MSADMASPPALNHTIPQPMTPRLLLQVHRDAIGVQRPATQAGSFASSMGTPRMITARTSVDFLVSPRRRPSPREGRGRYDKECTLVGSRKGPRPHVGMRVVLSRQAERGRWQELSMERVSGIINIVYDDYVWVKWENGQGHWHNTGKNGQYELIPK
jgi:hypothetical protein